jgi:hypothetical protein
VTTPDDDVIDADYALARAVERARVDNTAEGWAAVAFVLRRLHANEVEAVKTPSGYVIKER